MNGSQWKVLAKIGKQTWVCACVLSFQSQAKITSYLARFAHCIEKFHRTPTSYEALQQNLDMLFKNVWEDKIKVIKKEPPQQRTLSSAFKRLSGVIKQRHTPTHTHAHAHTAVFLSLYAELLCAMYTNLRTANLIDQIRTTQNRNPLFGLTFKIKIQPLMIIMTRWKAAAAVSVHGAPAFTHPPAFEKLFQHQATAS